MKTLILGLGVVLAGVMLVAPTPHPQPQDGPPGGPKPPCCHVVANDLGTAHVPAGHTR